MDQQWWLDPESKDFLVISPSPATWIQLHLKLKQKLCRNETHLSPGQVLSKAVPRTKRKWLQAVAVILIVGMLILYLWQLPFRNKFLWAMEILRIMIAGIVIDSNSGPSRHKTTGNDFPVPWHDPRECDSHRWIYPHRFKKYSVGVSKVV